MHTKASLIRVTHPEGLDKHMQRRVDALADAIMDALSDAEDQGLVVEVSQDPGTPLAQGNYYPHIRIRERKDIGMNREAWERQLAGGVEAASKGFALKVIPPKGT